MGQAANDGNPWLSTVEGLRLVADEPVTLLRKRRPWAERRAMLEALPRDPRDSVEPWRPPPAPKPADDRFVSAYADRDYCRRTHYVVDHAAQALRQAEVTARETPEAEPPPGLVCSARLGKVAR